MNIDCRIWGLIGIALITMWIQDCGCIESQHMKVFKQSAMPFHLSAPNTSPTNVNILVLGVSLSEPHIDEFAVNFCIITGKGFLPFNGHKKPVSIHLQSQWIMVFTMEWLCSKEAEISHTASAISWLMITLPVLSLCVFYSVWYIQVACAMLDQSHFNDSHVHSTAPC